MADTTILPRQGKPAVVRAGLVLHDFKLVELIGKGGMGEVWRAENVRVKSIVRAIKVIKAELAALPDFRTRFLREAEYLDALQHPNVLLVQSIGEDQGLLFMVMELLQGQGIDDLVKWSPGKLPPADVAGLVQQALIGVAHAHSRGIVHRDLKPQNLFLTTSGTVKVLDFGIARADDAHTKLTRVGVAPGSPAYLAPEIAGGGQGTARSDVYSMGITLYELLTGKLPFAASEGTTDYQAALSIMFQHATKPLPDVRESQPGLADGIVEVLLKATAKKPEDRYADAGEFARALGPFAGAESQVNLSRLTPPPGPQGTGRFTPPPRDLMVREPQEGAGTRFEVPDAPVSEAAEPPEEAGAKRRRWLIPALLALMAIGASVGLVSLLRRAGQAQAGHSAPSAAGLREVAPNPTVPAGMALIPGGTLSMGRAPYGEPTALDTPAHPVEVRGFAIEKTEVTNGAYKAFVDAGKASAPWPPSFNPEKRFAVIAKQPVINVGQDDASNYCRWKYGGRLPTEAEWEWAARGKEGRLYPWGNEFQRVCVNGLAGEEGVPQDADQNRCGATPEGVLDLSGNVWEWTSSPASVYPGSSLAVPPAGLWMVRGGSFFNQEQNQLTATSRLFAGGPNRALGFRCVVEVRE